MTQSPQPEIQQVLFPYGVGIDTHSQFIAVCILIKRGEHVERHEKEYQTTWPDLIAARDWVMAKLGSLATGANLRYCIESTGTYHLPVLRAWQGIPTVVNPMLAAPTRRKTDVLDARLLAHHSITGMWPKSFIPEENAQILRVLFAQRREATRAATRASNRINNIILRFGHTLGRDFAMRTGIAEGVLTDLVEGKVPKMKTICPDGFPEAARPVLAALLNEMHEATANAKSAQMQAVAFIKENDWPSTDRRIPGRELLELLTTVPGVGITTALAWLSEVCDPNRFQQSKHVAAYCGCDPSLKTSAGKVTSFVRRSGNTKLHGALLYAAGSLLRTKHEQIGQWGASIAGRHKKGGYRKALGACARRVAVGLWHVHRTGTAFSYEKYNLAFRPGVRPCSVPEMLPAYPARLLKLAGYKTSTEVAAAYFDGKLTKMDGFGAKCVESVKEWIKANTTQIDMAVPQVSKDGKKAYHVDMGKPKTFKPKAKKVKLEVDEEELARLISNRNNKNQQ